MRANSSPKSIILNTLTAALGLILFGFGIYLTIQANLGVEPWDTFHTGLSKTLGIKYGTASISVSLIILLIDILLKEKIGIGMILDTFIVGKTVDLCDALHIVPLQSSLPAGIFILFCGMVVMGFSQYFYMKAGLGCGPRDSLLVGLSRRLHQIPIGVVGSIINVSVTVIGYLLGGKVGIGTLISALLLGPIMQFAFQVMHFDATKVVHQDIIRSFQILKKTSTR